MLIKYVLIWLLASVVLGLGIACVVLMREWRTIRRLQLQQPIPLHEVDPSPEIASASKPLAG